VANDLSEESPDASLLALARILFAGQTAQATLEAVARLAQETIPGCDAASVTVMENGHPRTTVATAETAEALDQRQYDTDTGPCLDAIRKQRTVRVDSFEETPAWPEFTPAALDRGVRSSLSLPLVALDEPVGALNLYSHAEAGFADAEPTGHIFATQAAVTLANATAFHRALDLARNLTAALEHRDVIGQAKGILMAQQGVSSEEAFDLLRRASQRTNRKLHELAVELVDRRNSADPGA
jgi:GAF domain-containing protein